MKFLFLVVKWLITSICLAVVAWATVSFFLYRLTNKKKPYLIQGKVIYKLLETEFSNRAMFENLMGNRVIRIEGHPPVYIANRERKTLWPESPIDLDKKAYTIKAAIEIKDLLFGGVSKGILIYYDTIDEHPHVIK